MGIFRGQPPEDSHQKYQKSKRVSPKYLKVLNLLQIIMNKASLIDVLAERLGVPRAESEKMINTLFEVITDTIKNGQEVTITGFGAFSVRERKGRTGVNPRNISEKIQIPPVKVPKFKAGKSLKEAVR
ncbi:MAG: HU family DNA-binding protein [Patescibacteria group bacterium]